MRFFAAIFIFFLMVNLHANELVGHVSFVVNTSHSKNMNIIIPFKQGVLLRNSELLLVKNNKPIDFDIKVHLLWPSNEATYVRALALNFTPEIGSYDIYWKESLRSIEYGLFEGETLDVVFKNDWLVDSSYSPLRPKSLSSQQSWFLKAFQKYADFITNAEEVSKSTKGKLTFLNPSPWLFDRPYTLYLLYFKTGDVKWKKEAHKAAEYYRKNINERGYFNLQTRDDLKYLMPSGLLIDYLFYPNAEVIRTLESMYENSLSWPLAYDSSMSFWTERNLAAAISLPLVLWEVTKNQKYKKRLDNLITSTQERIFIPPTREGGCIKHQYRAHEGTNDKTLICSPWMSALLVEQLWRYYLISEDKSSAALIDWLGTEVVNSGTYTGNYKHLKGFTIPNYLLFFGNSPQNQPNQWTDIQHSCDIAAMVAKSAYIRKENSKPIALHKVVVEGLLKSCKKTIMKPNKLTVWPIRPLRKFNWWFNSTGDIEWLLEEINLSLQ